MVRLILQYNNIQYPHQRTDTPLDIRINTIVQRLRHRLMQIDDPGEVVIKIPDDIQNMTDDEAKLKSEVISFVDMDEETMLFAKAIVDGWQIGM